MTIRIGINGFGRIGRLVLRAARSSASSDIQVVGINDLSDAETLGHLLEWDTVHGRFQGSVEASGDHLIVDGEKVRVSSEADPARLPWRELDVEIAIEATGKFRDLHHAARHLEAGAKRVLITAPAKDAHATLVPGVNDDSYDPVHHFIVSAASCTTNCLAPMAKVLHETFGIERGWMTTVHAYTNDQRILDGPHKDLRRARAAGLCMIPTTTGAARATGQVLPDLAGKLDGIAVRVPTANVSLVDLVVQLSRTTNADEINEAFREAAEGSLVGVLSVCDRPLVSSDFCGNPHSSIIDAPSTRILDGELAKVLAWYDNEWGYANRVIDLVAHMAHH